MGQWHTLLPRRVAGPLGLALLAMVLAGLVAVGCGDASTGPDPAPAGDPAAPTRATGDPGTADPGRADPTAGAGGGKSPNTTRSDPADAGGGSPQDPSPAGPTAPARAAGVVSLSPAATDLLAAMGLGERVVGVSTQEPATSPLGDRPRVGDYFRTDWEQITALHPGYMIVQGRLDRMPRGLAERAVAKKIELIDLQIDRAADVLGAIDQIGAAIDAGARATALRAQIEAELNQVRQEVARQAKLEPAVRKLRVLIVINEEGTSGVGRATFLDDLLTTAGGENVLLTDGYPMLDREKVRDLAPDAVLQLLPGADDAAVARAKSNWTRLADTPAVKNGRVYIFRDADVLIPASRIGALAKAFYDRLYGQAPRDPQ